MPTHCKDGDGLSEELSGRWFRRYYHRCLSAEMTMSTRRFCAQPGAVRLLVTG